jgi:glycerophosphoryl diester phosphodiesterase
MGADGIELDVRRTADAVLIVHHDPALPDGRAIVETVAHALPATVPTLHDALDACAGAFVNIEVKNDPSEPDFDPSDWVVGRLAVELARRGEDTRWLVSSFRLRTIDRFAATLPTVRTALLTSVPDAEAFGSAVRRGHRASHPDVRFVDEASIRAAHAVGLAVNTWTCNDAGRMRELIAWGVDGICTDVPDVALAVRRREPAQESGR